jgi:hypothetical protein
LTDWHDLIIIRDETRFSERADVRLGASDIFLPESCIKIKKNFYKGAK